MFDDAGRVVHRRGVTAAPGLYFLGLPWQHTRGSALLGWVKDDAEYIADQIAARAAGGMAPGDAPGRFGVLTDAFPPSTASGCEPRQR